MATITYDEMNEMLKQAISRFKELGYKVGKITTLDVSSRYSHVWAKCKRTRTLYNTYFTITVSDRLFKANKESVRDIIHHEVIHTIPECFNHGIMFKNAAGHCNKKFGTNISVRASDAVVYFGKNSKVENYIKCISNLLEEAAFCNS